MVGFISILIAVCTMVLLVAGLIISKKYAFMGGFYFFLLLIIKQISGPIMNYYVDSVVIDNGAPMGMTIGQYIVWLSFIPRMLDIIAFSFLVVGLYKLWKSSIKI